VLGGLCDLRIPLAMSGADAANVGAVIRGALDLVEATP
jgi:hypothetical protein